MNRIATGLIFIIAMTVAAAGQSAAGVSTTYDEAKGETTIEAKMIPLGSVESSDRLLSISHSFKGKKLTARPDEVMLVVSVINPKGHKFPQINHVVFSADGKDLGKVILLNLDQRDLNNAETVETLGTWISFDTFRKVAASKTQVTFKIAQTVFTLERSVLDTLVAYEKAVTP